jgi:DNA primase
LPRGFIPDNIIEEIKSRSDIIDVISEYVPLTAAGKNFKGLCPFHEEKTPSFMVSRDRQMFKCFGCNEAGDVFTFLMKHEKMTYPEAVRFLAAKYGVVIPETTRVDRSLSLAIDELRKLNGSAVNYFHKLLMGRAGKGALTYLRERGIRDNAIESFKLGYSLPSWSAFLKAAGKAGFSTEIMLQGGFILQGKKQDNYYDRFRGRIMFPIFDARGDPIGFGGRILDDSLSDVKYMNSPETPLYNKSRSLYNLNLAKEAIRKEGCTILAEGYLDVITCFQGGVHNIVASLGTSLSEGHVNLMKRHTDEVIIAYDSDSAGTAATSRGLNLLVKGGLKVRILALPPDKDPDDFIRENGVKSFRDLVSGAVDLVSYKLDRVKEQVEIDSAEGKKQTVRDLVTTLANLSNQVEKHEYVKKCAEELDVEEDYIWQQLEEVGSGKRVRRSTQPTIKSSAKKLSAREAIERRLLECLIQYPQFILRARSQLTKEDFSNPGHAELAEVLWMSSDLEEGRVDLGTLMNRCTSKESREIISRLVLRKSFPPDGEADFDGCMKKMREFREREFRRSVLKEDTGDSLSTAKRLMELRRRTKSTIDSF